MTRTLGVVVAAMLFSCRNENSTDLYIAVASNAQFAFASIIAEFEKRHDVQCITVTSGSGKIVAQIRNGAPFDVFVSADMDYPQALHADGYAALEPSVYAAGELVLWSAKTRVEWNDLNSPTVEKIAVANPRFAPYGRATREAFITARLFEQLEAKIVFGESVAQVNHFVVSGAVDVGVTAKASVMAGDNRTFGNWTEVDSSLYSPIRQGILVIGENTSNSALTFVDFVLSPEGQKILDNFGYITNVAE